MNCGKNAVDMERPGKVTVQVDAKEFYITHLLNTCNGLDCIFGGNIFSSEKNDFFGFVIVYSKFVFKRPFYQMMEFFKYVNVSVLWHQESGVICIFKELINVRFGLKLTNEDQI